MQWLVLTHSLAHPHIHNPTHLLTNFLPYLHTH